MFLLVIQIYQKNYPKQKHSLKTFKQENHPCFLPHPPALSLKKYNYVQEN